jgi:hypothetical protein
MQTPDGQSRRTVPYALAGAAFYFGLLGILAIPVWKICASLRIGRTVFLWS